MSTTLILAEKGVGKTSLLTCILKNLYQTRKYQLWSSCCKELERLNKNRKVPFEFPDEPPIYTDITSFTPQFTVGYKKIFKPYSLNPYYMGVKTEGRPTQFVLPYSQIFIPEITKYADSRKSSTFPRAWSRVFEIERHFHLDFYLDGHKSNFVDLKIRGMCNRVIDLLRQEHEKDELGRIIKTTWFCREFPNIEAYEAFYANEPVAYKETTYENRGNIFNDYNSFGCEDEFVPPEGTQFSTIRPATLEDISKLPKNIARLYDTSEPNWFRKQEYS